MIIIWSGRGGLTVVVFFVSLLSFVTILPDEYKDYSLVAACFTTGLFSWFFGNKWNNVKGRILVDEATGRKVTVKRNHSLFWIKMQYWGIIFSMTGIIILFQHSIMAAVVASMIFASIIVYFYMNGNKNRNITAMKNDVELYEDSVIQKEKTVETESEEERLMRRREKEDPRRFMPPH